MKLVHAEDIAVEFAIGTKRKEIKLLLAYFAWRTYLQFKIITERQFLSI